MYQGSKREKEGDDNAFVHRFTKMLENESVIAICQRKVYVSHELVITWDLLRLASSVDYHHIVERKLMSKNSITK